jgi:hypothetical protein
MVLGGTPSADAIGLTGFLQSASPHSRPGIGFAVSVSLFTEILTLEGEYSRARAETTSPSLTVWSGNILLVLPVEVVRLKPYLATGFGVYRQLAADASETSFCTLPGFGTYIRLAGPLHGRIEYRFIRLRGSPLQGNQRRFYGGLTLKF